MPTINILENLNGLINNLSQIREQSKNAEAESFRIEGMIRVFKNLQDVGVTEIPVPEKPVQNLEPLVEEQVLDEEAAVQEAESKQE